MSTRHTTNTYDAGKQEARYEQNIIVRALISGILSLVLGLVGTYLAVQVIPLQWEFEDALLAVGVASFAAAFLSVWLNRALAGRDEGPKREEGYNQNTFARALISGILSLVLGLVGTYVAVRVIPLEWDLNDALLAVGAASFAAALLSVALNRALAGRDEGPEHNRMGEVRR